MHKKYAVLEDLRNRVRFIVLNNPMPYGFLKHCILISLTDYHSYAKKVCKKGKRFDFDHMIANMRRTKIYAQ